MTDDDLADLDDDEDDDGDDLGTGQGRAAVIHRTESLDCRFTFADSVAEAVRQAEQQPCPVDRCLGVGHMVVYGDGGRLRIVADTDGDEVIGRFNDLLRVRERRRLLRARLGYAERQRRRRAANREALEREDPDVNP